uniref:Uncharacterized protein n=1 Tax=Mycena chlorophos TaxID=658473 RepID=A0ABQ0MB45_MYCCL|nr:predicted protein [Mycena chlorophos]
MPRPRAAQSTSVATSTRSRVVRVGSRTTGSKALRFRPIGRFSKRELLLHAIRRRLVKRARSSRSPSTQYASRALSFTLSDPSTSPPDSATLPIALPQISFPLLALFPETDSGYCSDASRSSSPLPVVAAAHPHPAPRRYILPDPNFALSPSDLFSQDVCVRLSALPDFTRIASFKQFAMAV